MFVAFATACAALLGLFYVAVSLHVDILNEHPVELNRANSGLDGLLLGLLMSLLVLVPGQADRILGAELLILVLVYSGVATFQSRIRLRGVPVPVITRVNSVVTVAVTVVAGLGGVSLIVDTGPGLYLLVPSVLASIFLASFYARSVLFISRRSDPDV